MTWTYGDAPFDQTSYPPYTAAVARDTVRFLIGDTKSTDQQLSDGEIAGLLVNNAQDVYQAAIEACNRLIALYSRNVTKSIGDASISASDRIKNYKMLKGEIALQSTRHGGAPVPYAGGISKTDMESDIENDDRPPMDFSIGMHDNPENSPDLTSGPGFSQVVPG